MGKGRWPALLLAILMAVSPLMSIGVQADGRGQWPMWGGDPQHSGFAAVNVTNDSHGVIWDIMPTGSGYFNGSYHHTGATPIIAADGTIYVSSSSGNVTAVDQSGSVIWTITVDGSPTNPMVLLSNGSLFLAAGADTVHNGFFAYCILINGTICWKAQVPGLHPYWTVVDGNDTIYVAAKRENDDVIHSAMNATLVAISRNGSVLWTKDCGSERFQMPAVSSNGTVYFLTGFHLYAFGRQGEMKWDCVLPYLSMYNRSEPIVLPDGSVEFLSSGILFRVSPTGAIVCSTNISEDMDHPGNLLYDPENGMSYAVLNNEIIAVDGNGTVRWRSGIPNGDGFSLFRPVLIQGNRVILMSNFQLVCLYLNATLSIVWQTNTLTGTGFGFEPSGLAVGRNGTIYVAMDYGGGESNAFHLIAVDELPEKTSSGEGYLLNAIVLTGAAFVFLALFIFLRRHRT